jgi:N-acetylglucosaminyldiphosphoundecaprenol N-acetyl-beta-D-mannosaminyltransferase
MNGTLGLDRRQAAEELYARLTGSGQRKNRVRRTLLALTWALGVAALGSAKRALDFCFALLLLVVTSPAWIALLFVDPAAGPRLVRTVRVGRWAQTFQELSFPIDGAGRFLQPLHVRRLPALINILRGDMSFIGPRAVSPGELSPRDRIAYRRYDVRPGLVCLWWVRQRANIAYENEALSDAEYVQSQTLLGDFALALRAIPAVMYGHGVANAPDEFRLMGIRIHNVTMAEAVETIVAWNGRPEPRQIVFVNADCANIAWRDPRYAAILNQADLTLGDGIGIKVAARALGLQLKQNVNGTDMFPRLCEALQNVDGGVFLLGARPGITEAVAAWMANRYPGLKLAGFHHGYFGRSDEQGVLEEIRASGATVLLVALGAPHQDLWISRNLAATGVRVAMGVGGLFDFYSGRIPRAPQWLREMGFEWAYRLYQEPGRMWRRYLVGNVTFLYHVALQRLRDQAVDRNASKGINV